MGNLQGALVYLTSIKARLKILQAKGEEKVIEEYYDLLKTINKILLEDISQCQTKKRKTRKKIITKK